MSAVHGEVQARRGALADLQREFQSQVLAGTGAFRERISEGPRGRRDERLAVYTDGYRSRLVEAFTPEFATLRAVLGDELLDLASRQYVEATPSPYRNIRWYGDTFADFLAHTAPWSARPLLAEIARFEWTLTLAFDAPDAPVVGFDDIVALPPEAWNTLAFRLHPAVHLVTLASNAAVLRRALDEDDTPPEPAAAEPVTWLVWRQDLSVHFRSLDEAEAWALQAAREGSTFPALCEGACQWFAPEDAPAIAAGWLRGWVEQQLVSGLTW